MRQLDKKKKKLMVLSSNKEISVSKPVNNFQAKGIKVTIESLREEHELKKDDGEVAMSEDDDDEDDVGGEDTDEIIDVVGEEGVGIRREMSYETRYKHALSDNEPNEAPAHQRRKPSHARASFSIYSLLSTSFIDKSKTSVS